MPLKVSSYRIFPFLLVPSALIVLPVLLLSCAPATIFGSSTPFNDVTVAPESKHLTLLNEKHLAVNLTYNELAVGNGPDVAEDIPRGDAEKVYLTFFAEKLPQILRQHSVFSDAILLTWTYDTNFSDKVYTLRGNRKMRVHEPKPHHHFSLGQDSSRFILFILGLNIVREEASYTLFSTSPPQLVQQTEFLMWDNAEGRVALYGRTEVGDEFMSNVGMSNWENNLASTIKTIFWGTPFYKK